ncbi:MAG: response regulator [Rubrobacteraceae bacterium]
MSGARRIPGSSDGSRAWLLYLVLGLVATVMYSVLSGAVQDTLYNLIGASALIAILVGVRRNRPVPALPWYIVVFGLALYVAGDVVFFNLYENVLGVPAPFPSVADALYLSSYLVVAFGLVSMISRRSGRDWGGLIDSAIIAAGLALLSWEFLMEPYAEDQSIPLFPTLVAIDYPLSGVLWFAIAARLLFVPGRRPPAFYLLFLGILFHPIADAVYGVQVIEGTYQSGTLLDSGWLLSYVFFGAAALHPSMRELPEAALGDQMGLPGWRLALLATAALLAPTVLAVEAAQGETLELPVVIDMFILFSLVLLRMAGFLRENERAAAEVRLLNERLEERVEERTAELQGTIVRLKESEERANLVLAASSDGIWEWDIRTGEEYWNESLYELLGYSRDEVTPSFETFLDMVHPEDRSRIMERLNNYLEYGGRYYEGYRMRDAGGEYRVYASHAKARHDETGAPVRMAGTVVDITAQKQYEEELRETREAADTANRAKSEFLANMSHEIRTPMNGVIGMTGLLLDSGLTEEQREYAETVRVSGENLLTIINDILDFSKIESGKLDLEVIDFDLGMVAEEAIGLFAERAHARGLELASLVEQDVPHALRGDSGRLTQVLTNLLGNAVKFTEEGEVVLRVGLDGETNGETNGAAMVRFEVTDTGIGMTHEQRSRLFQPFSQADASTTRRYGGTGLGLAISRQLVELMDGEIGVESAPGAGSTFWFRAPLARQPEGGRIAPMPRMNLRGLRVLVVDDNETNRKIVHHQVISWGMRNGMAGDGPGALRKLREAAERGDPYDLTILDMQMPGMDGMELAQRIKADPALAHTRLVMMSSLGRRDAAGEARRNGISAYLTKPVRQSRLYDAIATAMGAPEEATPEKEERLVALDSLEEATTPRIRVLVAEDNAVNQKVAVKMLERLGYRADVAADGVEAVEAVSRIPYAAILMDVQMPEMNGYEATQEIREREEGAGRRTPIIAMTANALEGDREKALAAGMDDYVPKPVNPGQLGVVLGRWVSRDEAASDPENPLDPGAIENLRDLGGPEMLAELTEMFVDNSGSEIHALKEAARRGDARFVEQTAHGLKGSSGSMGATGMEKICTELELQSAGASGDLTHVSGLIEGLEAEFGRVRPALEAEVARSGKWGRSSAGLMEKTGDGSSP